MSKSERDLNLPKIYVSHPTNYTKLSPPFIQLDSYEEGALWALNGEIEPETEVIYLGHCDPFTLGFTEYLKEKRIKVRCVRIGDTALTPDPIGKIVELHRQRKAEVIIMDLRQDRTESHYAFNLLERLNLETT